MTEALMTRRDVAKYLAVPEATLARWAYTATGPAFFKVGRHARYRRADLDAWLESQRASKR
jgi:excisionase family DNA binding protein